MTTNGTKILIVDDHPLIRRALAQLIQHEADFLHVGEAASAIEALERIEAVHPDCVIVDISLQGVSGIELTRTIVTRHPQTRVLIVSMHDESLYAERALRAGAKGYVMKHAAIECIVEAIRTVMRGEIYVSEAMHTLMVRKALNGHASAAQPIMATLSDRELEVIQLMGQGFSTRHIAETLHISVKTIESHYANVKTKLGLKNAHELMRYAVHCCGAEQ